jgi:common-antigen outer membrane protein
MGIGLSRNCGKARPGRAAILAVIALLAGCQSIRPPEPEAPAPARAAAPAAPQAAQSELLQFVARAAPGSARLLSDARWGQVRVTAGRQYFSADGLLCRHFTLFPAHAAAGGDGETGAACREADGWRLDPVTSKGTALVAR